MIDTHAHIDFEVFNNDREEVILRAFDEGVENIIIPAVEPKNFDKLLELVNSTTGLYCGMGIHPHNALDADDKQLLRVEKLSSEKKVVAIGETGLDYYYDFAPKDVQQSVFRTQLQIAKRHNLPVIVHNREADEDIIEIISQEQDGTLSGVMHCFSGTFETMEKALELGFNISFTGNITFIKKKYDKIIEQLPLEKIMLETDCPFMTPIPHRGKRNEPAFVKYVAQKIAEIKSMTIEEVISMTTETSKKFFKLLMIALLLLSFQSVYSQQEETTTADELSDIEMAHPYSKFIGIGPLFGTNTIVETYYLKNGAEDDESYEGLMSYGGLINYGLFDFLILEAAYTYSKNNKIAEKNNYLVKPNIHHGIEISSLWIPNPYSRISLFGSIGYTAFFNSINDKTANSSGINVGIGFIINMPVSFGLFNVRAEWKLNYELARKIGNDPNELKNNRVIQVNTSAYYSIPRVGIIFYPKLF